MNGEKMCPCGCGLTWDEARRAIMANENTAYSADQAEAMLERVASRGEGEQ